MRANIFTAFASNFLGRAPGWYKLALVAFLIINPIVFAALGPFAAGWLLVFEFLLTLAMALQCYPLGPGGLLALEAIFMGLAKPAAVYAEIEQNLPVILLLVFMVAGIYFLQELLLLLFTRILLGIRSTTWLALLFCGVSALLSAFLDALTVTAVIIAVAEGFYAVYHKAASGKSFDHKTHEHDDDSGVSELSRADLEQFRAFLRTLMMHAVVGTALGGIATLVGEPQNLLIGHMAHWHFVDFVVHVAPVSIPVLIVGLTTCVVLQKTRWFDYGVELPDPVRHVLDAHDRHARRGRSVAAKVRLSAQGVIAVLLIIALAFHVAEIGLIGLALLVLTTTFSGVVEERRIGHAFEEALPFTALLVVFFSIVVVIDSQELFSPIMAWVLHFDANLRAVMVYLVNGALSMISDNVFVATVYMKELNGALTSGVITIEQFQHLAVAVNVGTNIPSVATPNGQAAFLFLLTSALAPLIRLSYGRMVWMALPYTLALSVTGCAAVMLFL